MQAAIHERCENACRVGSYAAVGTLLGIVLSGPLALWIVEATHPQPAWLDADRFAANHHPVQIVPYLGGILLVGSLLILLASVHALAPAARKATSGAALAFSAAFASLIFFNYAIQCTFLPTLATHNSPEDAAIVAALSMANPTSLAWAVEMWGWALFGVATWLAAAVFGTSRLERVTATTFIANGVVSVAGALLTVARPGWVMTPTGLVAFALWNLLLAVLAGSTLLTFRRWMHPHGGEAAAAGSAAPA